MDNYELVEKWLAIFGKDVDKKVINDHVTSYGNHLWHLFTWGNVSCVSGEEARKTAHEALKTLDWVLKHHLTALAKEENDERYCFNGDARVSGICFFGGGSFVFRVRNVGRSCVPCQLERWRAA